MITRSRKDTEMQSVAAGQLLMANSAVARNYKVDEEGQVACLGFGSRNS